MFNFIMFSTFLTSIIHASRASRIDLSRPPLYDQNFISAVQKNDIGLLKKLIGDGANPNSTNYRGESALVTAMRYGYDSMVEYLLTLEGIDADSVSSEGRNALSYATEMGKVELVKLLIPYSNIELQDHTGRRARDYTSPGPRAERSVRGYVLPDHRGREYFLISKMLEDEYKRRKAEQKGASR